MKFFTSEWWAGCQTGDGRDAVEAFEAHRKTIRNRLTPELLALQERISLHDANLLELSIAPDERVATLRLKLADRLMRADRSELELRYSGVTGFESFQSADHALGGPGGYGDLGYDEVDVLDDGSFEHRMLFSSSIELRFRFTTLELRPWGTS